MFDVDHDDGDISWPDFFCMSFVTGLLDQLCDELMKASEGKKPETPLLGMPRKETVNENFKRDCAKAAIQRKTRDGKLRFPSFRVNYINSVVESGTDLKTIMTLARHGSAQMSMETYAKPKPDRLRAAAESANSRLEEILGDETYCTDTARRKVSSK
jgi:hypothetical protein